MTFYHGLFSGPGTVTVGTGVKYSLHQEKGAALELKPPGWEKRICSKGKIKEYMKHNLDYWQELANREGSQLGLKAEDLVFIFGVVTTTEWTVIALQGQTSQQVDFSLNGEANAIAAASVNVSVSNSLQPQVHHRRGHGYTGNPVVVPGRPQIEVANPAPGSNQCLFVHYCKMKRRLLFIKTIEASAGPHQLPPGEDDRNPEFDFTEATVEGTGVGHEIRLNWPL